MRGGRGGRGGRFGRGGRNSITQDLLRDNLEDLEQDQRTYYEDRAKPVPLYPNIEIAAPKALTEDEAFCVQKLREIAFRCQSSVYYLSNKQEEKDIVRFSDSSKSSAKNANILKLIKEQLSANGIEEKKHFPTELLAKSLHQSALIGSKRKREAATSAQLSLLLEKENKGVGEEADADAGAAKSGEEKDGKEGKNGEDGSDGEANENDGDEDFEMDDDYGVDHYASDDDRDGYGDDGGGGGDNEATF